MPRHLRLVEVQIERHKEIRERVDEWRALHIKKREYPMMRGIHIIYFYIGFLRGREYLRKRGLVIQQTIMLQAQRRLRIKKAKRLARISETYWEEFSSRERRIIRRYSRLLEEQRELIRTRQKAVMRSQITMWRIIDPIQSYLYRLYAIDKVLIDQPEDIRTAIREALIKIAKKNPLFSLQIQENPLLRKYAKQYILYYQPFPHTHNIYAVRLSPLMMSWLEEQEAVFYVSRVISAEALKQTALLESSTYVMPYVYKISSKRSGEVWNSSSYAGRGKVKKDTEIALARDDKHQPLRIIKLIRAIFHPHLVKRAFARMLGRRELHDEIDTRSVYAMLGRRGKRDKLYEAKVPLRILTRIRRRRVKDFLAENRI